MAVEPKKKRKGKKKKKSMVGGRGGQNEQKGHGKFWRKKGRNLFGPGKGWEPGVRGEEKGEKMQNHSLGTKKEGGGKGEKRGGFCN